MLRLVAVGADLLPAFQPLVSDGQVLLHEAALLEVVQGYGKREQGGCVSTRAPVTDMAALLTAVKQNLPRGSFPTQDHMVPLRLSERRGGASRAVSAIIRALLPNPRQEVHDHPQRSQRPAG